jgi:hypothetical protein
MHKSIYKLTSLGPPRNTIMRVVEQINPMDACNNDEVMKNQYAGSTWADSLNSAVTRALYNGE